MTTRYKRWISDSADGRDLQRYIRSGEITNDMTPKDVRQVFEQFQKYSPNHFAGALARLRVRYGQDGANLLVANTNAAGFTTPMTVQQSKSIFDYNDVWFFITNTCFSFH